MFNFSILTARATALAFWQMLTFLCVYSVRMVDICAVRYKLQVFKPVVSAIKVFVVDFKPTFYRAIKSLPHSTMHTFARVFASSYKTYVKVVLSVQASFYGPIGCITRPSLALLDGVSCGYASTQKSSNLFKSSALLKHLFSFGNFGSVKRFCPSNPAHIAKVANFVQAFKAKNWFPCFHNLSPFNMNRSIA